MTLSPAAERVVALLTEERFARDDVEDLLALMILSNPPEQLDDDAAELVGRFATRAGLAPGAGAEDVRAAIARYLKDKPPSEPLVAALHALARDHALDSDVGAAAQRFTGVLGGGGERPQGTVPAGPMARFLVDSKKK